MELTRFESGKLMSDLLDDTWSPFGGRELPFGRQTLRPFEADVVELGEEMRVTAELPGVRREDIDIALENNVLLWGRDRSGCPRGPAELDAGRSPALT